MKNSGSQKIKSANKVNTKSPMYKLLSGKWLGRLPAKNTGGGLSNPKNKNVA